MKINFWIYIVVYLLLTLLAFFLIDIFFPFNDSEEDINWQTFVEKIIVFIIAFIPVYLLYSKIEKGKADFSDSLRCIISIVFSVLAVNIFYIPFAILYFSIYFPGSILEGILYGAIFFVRLYVIGGILIIFLLIILSRLNKTSFLKELEKSLKKGNLY